MRFLYREKTWQSLKHFSVVASSLAYSYNVLQRCYVEVARKVLWVSWALHLVFLSFLRLWSSQWPWKKISELLKIPVCLQLERLSFFGIVLPRSFFLFSCVSVEKVHRPKQREKNVLTAIRTNMSLLNCLFCIKKKGHAHTLSNQNKFTFTSNWNSSKWFS